MMPKTAKNAMTMRKDMLVRSRDPHVPFLLRFLEAPTALLLFFEDSFEYIFLSFQLLSVPTHTNTFSPIDFSFCPFASTFFAFQFCDDEFDSKGLCFLLRFTFLCLFARGESHFVVLAYMLFN